MATPERCLQCAHWNFKKGKCDRVIKIKLFIAHGGGDLEITTQPGLIPPHLEEELSLYLTSKLPDLVDAWPGWTETLQIKGKRPCTAEQPNAALRDFGSKLSLVKPLGEPQPEKNLDAHGLFKSDISLL